MGTQDPTPAPVVVRPGDLILVRAIAWWDSGQLKRILFGILGSAAPVIYDLFSKDALTWKTLLNALVFGLFVWLGYARAKAPDVVTNLQSLDRNNALAAVPPKLVADLKEANIVSREGK